MFREVRRLVELFEDPLGRGLNGCTGFLVPTVHTFALLHRAQSRKQFGQSICEFQLIQKKLVDMAVSLDAARFLTYRAAWLLDRGRRVTKESAMAKLFASEAAVQIANEAVQIYGGYGFIKDYPVEKFYRDIKLCTIGEGTSEIQTLVIARQLLSPQDQLTVVCS
jgi:alkylation response protein AidB-like acyl-CoA dehydrogenase